MNKPVDAMTIEELRAELQRLWPATIEARMRKHDADVPTLKAQLAAETLARVTLEQLFGDLIRRVGALESRNTGTEKKIVDIWTHAGMGAVQGAKRNAQVDERIREVWAHLGSPEMGEWKE